MLLLFFKNRLKRYILYSVGVAHSALCKLNIIIIQGHFVLNRVMVLFPKSITKLMLYLQYSKQTISNNKDNFTLHLLTYEIIE